VYRHGRKVVDLWGGLADAGAGRPWARDTLQLVYSATKAATATCAHLLAQRGELDLDRPAASYWPEFAAEGKAEIPVRWLLSHQAGLPVIDRPISLDSLLAWDPMTAALAAQRPAWEPGTGHGYHGRTYGWLVGEVIRRVSGRSVGTFFAEEIAGPAGLDFYIGLPTAERGRVSQMVIDDPPGSEVAAIAVEQIPKQFRPLLAAFSDPGSLMNRAFALSVPDIDFNDPAEQAAGTDRVLLVPSRFASGFMLPTNESPLGGPTSFGHPGRGGSLGFADPDSGIAFGYVVSHIRQDMNDTRAATLVNAVRACLQ
jgi:CubicO group peptidase (beta-lactamase class C family)